MFQPLEESLMARASALKAHSDCCSAPSDHSGVAGENAPTRSNPAATGNGDARGSHASSEGERDPVCGMKVDPLKTPHRQHYAGRSYYFCSAECRDKFSANPTKYLAPPVAKSPPPVPEGA